MLPITTVFVVYVIIRNNMRTLLSIYVAVAIFSQVQAQSFGWRLSQAAESLIQDKVVYDPSYFSIDYPNGDVPSDKGVCTDVVIRAYRKLGIDLQKLVHEDMKDHFDLYPNLWGLRTTDRNIDHRRVPNLMKYFDRHGVKLSNSRDPAEYLPGDVVSWRLSGAILHIGIVSSKKLHDGTPLIVHNIGSGQVIEDLLFTYEIIGHYRYGK